MPWCVLVVLCDGFLMSPLIFQAPQRDDALRVILHELDGVPNFRVDGEADELHNARDRAITLELTNRFAVVNGMLKHIIIAHLFNSFCRPSR
jgi:hypothetical protein